MKTLNHLIHHTEQMEAARREFAKRHKNIQPQDEQRLWRQFLKEICGQEQNVVLNQKRLTKRIELKSWPRFFMPVLNGFKTFEARLDDQDYAVGDILILQEWIPDDSWVHCQIGRYTGREVEAKVTYIMEGWTDDRQFGLEKGFVIMAIEVLKIRVPKPQ
jgi:hypothetical protein